MNYFLIGCAITAMALGRLLLDLLVGDPDCQIQILIWFIVG